MIIDQIPLKKAVIEMLDLEKENGITCEQNLFVSNVLDSFLMIKLIDDIECKYSIKISDADLISQNFNSVNAIVKTIQRYLGY